MFTIGIVTYKSHVYLSTQLSIYRQFAGEDFTIIIADTSKNNIEFEQVQKIVGQFSDISIGLFQFDPPSKYSSGAHGEGLQFIYGKVQTPYFLTQDPDFFWVKPKFLTFLKDKLEHYETVGAPYSSERADTWSGHPWFPSAWGCAYKMKNLELMKADFRWGDFLPDGSVKDVGWQIRQSLKNLSYYSFQQRPFKELGLVYENDMFSREFFDENGPIAHHLGHGSHEVFATKGIRLSRGGIKSQKRLSEKKPPKEWIENRKRACEFFWNKIIKAAGL